MDKAFQMHRLFEANDRAAFLATVGPHARAITTRGELGANAAMIAACPNLEVISVCGVVYDAVDLAPAQPRGMIRAEAWVRDGYWTEKGVILCSAVFGANALAFWALAALAAMHQIVSAKVIEALGPDGMLINISRAANIDEEALLAALEFGRLGSAALDVFDREPKLNPRFLSLPNVRLQPHHTSGTFETRKAMGNLLRDNLSAHFVGQPLPTPML